MPYEMAVARAYLESLPRPPDRLTVDAIEHYNQALWSRQDLRTIWLPIGDGVAVSVKA